MRAPFSVQGGQHPARKLTAADAVEGRRAPPPAEQLPSVYSSKIQTSLI
jgi:hypothetical protein